MIKLKNLWKVALAVMVMATMLVACDTTTGGDSDKSDSGNKTENNGGNGNGGSDNGGNGGSDNGGNGGSDNGGNGGSDNGGNGGSGIYIAGVYNSWANDTDAGAAVELDTTDAENVYTISLILEEDEDPSAVIPYGFKFTTANGWKEQYQAFNFESPTSTFTLLESGVESPVYASTKTTLEAPYDDDGNKPVDDATKWSIPKTKVFTPGVEYTITLDLNKMTVKLDGELADVPTKTITLTINTLEGTKLVITDVPVYADIIANTIDGSFFSWCGGTVQDIDVEDCEVTADWTGAEKNTWVAAQQPADAVEGADAWAKLVVSAGGEGWIPYSTTGDFTYSWNDKKQL